MQPRHMQEKSRGSRALTVFLSILVVLLAALCVLSWMLLSDPNAGRKMEAPSDAAVGKIAAAAVAGQECSLTPQEAGAWLNSMLQKKPAGGVSAVSMTAGADGTADVYFPVQYRGRTFGVLMNVTPSFDPAAEQMRFPVNSVRIGRLPVPVGWALSRMEAHLPEPLARDGDALVYDAKELPGVSYGGVSVQLKMTDLKLEDGLFKLKFGLGLSLQNIP